MKEIIKKYIKILFTYQCKYCKGRLKFAFYDTEIKKSVYVCESCKKKIVFI